MSCHKVKNTCEKPHPAECVSYETDLPESSSLFGDDCLSIEDTTTDLYSRTETLIDEIDLSELGLDCLTYVQEGGKTIVKNVLIKYEEEICTLRQEVEDLKSRVICDIPLTDCNLSYGTLIDSCGAQPSTLKDLLQVLINQHQA